MYMLSSTVDGSFSVLHCTLAPETTQRVNKRLHVLFMKSAKRLQTNGAKVSI